MTMSDPRHPVWPLFRSVVQLAGMSVVLYLTASNFDRTEVQTIAGSGVIVLLREYFGAHGTKS